MTPPQPNGRTLPGPLGLALIALLVLVAAGSLVLLFDSSMVSGFFNRIDTWIDAAGPFGGLLIIGLAIVHSIIFFPMELLAVAAGVSYGLVAGTFYMWLGSMAASCICFALARRLGRPFVVRWLSPDQAEKLDAWIASAGTTTLLVSRLLPIVSFNLVNYGAGLTSVGWWTFLWTTAIGILPILGLSVFFGTMMTHMPLSWLAGLTIVALLLWLILYLWNRRRRRSDT